jgi:hypothetical protein
VAHVAPFAPSNATRHPARQPAGSSEIIRPT